MLTISIFNINLRSRSEEQNYLHGCSQYIQYQPTFKIWRTKLFTRCSQCVQYQHTFKIWGAKQFTRFGLCIFNINLRSRSAEQIYTPLLTLSIFSISPRSISDVLNYLLGLPSIFNINLRSRSELLNYIHLLTISIFNINQRSISEQQNYLQGCP